MWVANMKRQACSGQFCGSDENPYWQKKTNRNKKKGKQKIELSYLHYMIILLISILIIQFSVDPPIIATRKRSYLNYNIENK